MHKRNETACGSDASRPQRDRNSHGCAALPGDAIATTTTLVPKTSMVFAAYDSAGIGVKSRGNRKYIEKKATKPLGINVGNKPTRET